MDVKVIVLEKATKWLVGGDLFEFIRQQVKIAANSDMTGEEKRAKVFAETKLFFGEVVNVFVNIAIEVAYLWLKTKTGEADANS